MFLKKKLKVVHAYVPNSTGAILVLFKQTNTLLNRDNIFPCFNEIKNLNVPEESMNKKKDNYHVEATNSQ